MKNINRILVIALAAAGVSSCADLDTQYYGDYVTTDQKEAAIEANPNYALAYYNLARSLSIKGEKVEAAKFFQIAYDINGITNEIDPLEIQERLNNLFE